MLERARSWLFAALALTLVSSAASAQGISGAVTDNTGALIPGVTVEASSPALIERTRTVVTNEAGRYSIVNLRPGEYTVTFSLAGFSTVRREGIRLTSDFTAQVNAQLQVGSLEENVTVSAASPVVDVQGTATPRVMTREVMDALPTQRSVPSIAATIPGATPSGPGLISYHGTTDAMTTVDGLRASKMDAVGAAMTARSFNNGAYQEYSYSTAIDSAEFGQPGMRINLVPKDGGNQFRGSMFAIFSYDDWMGSNLDDRLKGLGFSDPSTVRFWDLNPSFGGPIVRDKVWFQTTYDWTGTWNRPGDFFFDKNPSPFVYEADPTRPGLDSAVTKAPSARVTWQVTPKDKISGFFERTENRSPYSRLGSGPGAPPEAAVDNKSGTRNLNVRWTRTHTSRLLFEAGYSDFPSWVYNDYGREMASWSAVHVDDSSLPTGRPPAYAVTERTSGRPIGVAPSGSRNESTTHTAVGSATYVTGSHSLKAGFSFFNGTYHRPSVTAGLFSMTVFNGQPESVTLSIPGNERENVDGDWGLYVQDRWAIRRLTANLGLRYDQLKTSVPAQFLPATPWLPQTTFAAKDVLDYKDLSPRLGVAYDVFGNGKTAVKAALARYVDGETVGLTGAANPINAISTTDTRKWTDLNGDQTILDQNGAVEWNELGPSNNLNFGKPRATTTYDEDVLRGRFKRSYSWETNVGVQQEVRPGIAVTAGFYRRSTGNDRAIDNTLIGPGSYDTFCMTAPSDPRLPGGGGQRICGLSDLKSSARGLVNNYATYAETLGVRRTTITTGYEFSANARLPRGAFVQGGLNMNRSYQNTCDVIDDPDTRFCDTVPTFRPNVKINASYRLPFQVQVSGVYQGLSGPEKSAFLAVTSQDLLLGRYDSTLGRGLTSGTSKTVRLTEPGQNYLSMRHQFDLRFAKGFSFQSRRMQVLADFYNIFNSNAVTGVFTTFTPGSTTWLRPTGIASPRQFRLGAQIDF